MILTDAGPLAALVNRNDLDHSACALTAGTLRGPMVTTWVALAEAMYLLYREVGWKGQRMLWSLIEQNKLQVAHVEESLIPGIISSMEQYRDRPMDLADATLLALANERGFTRIFSIDSDFHIYRLSNGRTLEVVP